LAWKLRHPESADELGWGVTHSDEVGFGGARDEDDSEAPIGGLAARMNGSSASSSDDDMAQELRTLPPPLEGGDSADIELELNS
jgi:hypothetical protein